MSQETANVSVKESGLLLQTYLVLGLAIAVTLGIALGAASQIVVPNFWNATTITLCGVIMGIWEGVIFSTFTVNSAWTGALIGLPLSFGLVVARGGLPGFVFGFCFLTGLIVGFITSYGLRRLINRYKKAGALASKPASMAVGRPTC